jgi:hypothetical protein
MPQPAHPALLILLEEQAGAFGLGAEVGIGLQLSERPAGDVQDAEDRDSQREEDRHQIVERNVVAARQQHVAEPGGEDRHPRRHASWNHHQAQRGNAEAGDQRRGDGLIGGIERGEADHRK